MDTISKIRSFRIYNASIADVGLVVLSAHLVGKALDVDETVMMGIMVASVPAGFFISREINTSGVLPLVLQ